MAKYMNQGHLKRVILLTVITTVGVSLEVSPKS